ncbi:MAG: AGE family epimerase/isomerase [Lachnospiraceae bacterium]|nr:AGE family epimerase/isomerase [Lachnospiraceae bacterium]
MMKKEVKEHLEKVIIPFWKGLRDYEKGGYYGKVDYDLKVNKTADKGCILNSRILWFFANAYTLLKDETLLDEARHAYNFLKESCIDTKNGGIFWSIRHNGVVADTNKYTYNQAFAVYALASYYEASGDEEALQLAFDLFSLIEENCTDEIGYIDSFNEYFIEIENEELSENGVIAAKTMNTLLHVLEAYTELYRVAPKNVVRDRLEWILSTFAETVYNPILRRQEVFFDVNMNPIIDLHSYGHDIEAAWLIDRAVEVLGNRSYFIRMTPITAHLTDEIFKIAFDGHSLAYESEKGEVNETRVWWVQAEAVVGFLRGYKREPKRTEYLEAARSTWEYIKEYLIDNRADSEWFYEVGKDGVPTPGLPLAEPWKCPYHNGRMCFEVIKSEIEI